MKSCKFFNIKWDESQWCDEDRQITGSGFPILPTEISAFNFSDDFNPQKDGFEWLLEDTGFLPSSFEYIVEPYNEKMSKIVLAED